MRIQDIRVSVAGSERAMRNHHVASHVSGSFFLCLGGVAEKACHQGSPIITSGVIGGVGKTMVNFTGAGAGKKSGTSPPGRVVILRSSSRRLMRKTCLNVFYCEYHFGVLRFLTNL